MAIPDYARTNFNTLLRAAGDGNLALMECADALTGEKRYVIAAVGRDGGDFVFMPFGHLADGNPYEAYLPPTRTIRTASCRRATTEPKHNRGGRHLRRRSAKTSRRAITSPRENLR